MKVADIKKIATKAGIKPGKMKKNDLILAIQTAEGNIPCFMTKVANSCNEDGCLWRSDCIK